MISIIHQYGLVKLQKYTIGTNSSISVYWVRILPIISIRLRAMVALSIKASAGHLQAFESGSRLLVIETGATSLLLSLWDRQQVSPLAVELFNGLSHPDSDWEQMLQASAILQLKEIEARILVNTTRVVPVPMIFYKPEAAAEQLSMLHGTVLGYHQSADILAENGIAVAWEALPDWLDKLAGHFDITHTQCLGSLLVQKLLTSTGNEGLAKGFVAIDGDVCWMALARDGQLLMLKSIDMPQPDDFAYHLLNACHQWGLDKASVEWEWWGRVDSDAPLRTASERFFVCTLPTGDTAIPGNEIPFYYYGHHGFCLPGTDIS